MDMAGRELWGYCSPCSRWFFVPTRDDGQRPRPHEHRITCPVCVMPAGQFEGRDPVTSEVTPLPAPQRV